MFFDIFDQVTRSRDKWEIQQTDNLTCFGIKSINWNFFLLEMRLWENKHETFWQPFSTKGEKLIGGD